jgi:Fingers domain of DNA polymerase lambda
MNERACVPHAGKKSAEKVKSILSDGYLERNVNLAADDEAVALAVFCNIWGIGPKKAQAWVAAGLRSVEDVRARQDIVAGLSVRERCGLLHAEDFQIRIPRHVRHSGTYCARTSSLVLWWTSNWPVVSTRRAQARCLFASGLKEWT